MWLSEEEKRRGKGEDWLNRGGTVWRERYEERLDWLVGNQIFPWQTSENLKNFRKKNRFGTIKSSDFLHCTAQLFLSLFLAFLLEVQNRQQNLLPRKKECLDSNWDFSFLLPPKSSTSQMNGVSPLASSSPWDPQPLSKSFPFLLPPSPKTSQLSRQPHPSPGVKAPLPSASAASSSFLSPSFGPPALEPNVSYPLLNKQFKLLYRAKDLMIHSQFQSAEYMVMMWRHAFKNSDRNGSPRPFVTLSSSSTLITNHFPFLSLSLFIFLSSFLPIFSPCHLMTSMMTLFFP